MIIPKMQNGTYENWLPTEMIIGGLWSATWEWIKGGTRERPEGEIPVVAMTADAASAATSTGLTIRWLGHSSVLIEISGRRVLTDPVFSQYASPIAGFVKRFSKPPVSVDRLRGIDAVVISHDHYDHLEEDTVVQLAKTGAMFFVPSGVGTLMREWGIPAQQITELSWWEQTEFRGLTFISVPARHFSGRGLFTRNDTLWAGWIVQSKAGKVFYSGDTGYADHFAAIGKKFGPFDLTIIKIGAYNEKWPYIHINPEEAVMAHREVGGIVMLPVHWATFPLALHPWDEPIIRAVKEANATGIRIITPMIGEAVDMDREYENESWWE